MMQQPIRLSVGYAYAMSNEALICTVEDGQPSHAFTLTVDDLRALLAAFGEDAPPQPHPLSHLPTPPEGVDLSKLRWNGEQWEVHQGYPIGHVVVDSNPDTQDGEAC